MKSLLKRKTKGIRSITLLLLVAMWCAACGSDEFNGQFPVKKTPPAPVTLLPDGVVNFPGGATITYQLPDETDLLYVKAVYQMPDGSVKEEKASVFSNTLTLRGFGRATTVKVQLITVDRSRNESSPVEVEIHPEESPIYNIFESLDVKEGWGGFTLQWNNPLKEKIVVQVLRLNDDVYEPIEAFYSEAAAIRQSVRGQPAVRADFGIYVRDVYNNYTDTLKLSMTPWYETRLDESKFVGIPLSTRFTISVNGTGDMTVLWDGITSANSLTGLYYINPWLYPPYIAINLGVKVKLSRFRIWSRSDYEFQLHHAKELQLYGTIEPMVGNNPESQNTEWTQLSPESFISVRPSGLDVSVPATAEDIAYCREGEEWEVPLDAPVVQWVRIQQVSSWTGSYGLTFEEIRFWGAPQ